MQLSGNKSLSREHAMLRMMKAAAPAAWRETKTAERGTVARAP